MVSGKHNILGHIAFLILVLAYAASPALGQLRGEGADSGLGGVNGIEGSVILPSGQRLDRRIRVRLFTMTRGDLTSMTDDSGRFSFRGLVNGDYTIVIDGEKEYEAFSQRVNILQFRGMPPVTVNVPIRLTLKPNTEPPAGVVNAELANVPQPALNFYNKALELAKDRDHKGAIEQLKLATDEYPKFMLAYNEIGVQYVQMNNYEEADKAFQAALKLEPEAFMPLKNRGVVLVCLNKFSDAEVVLKNALKVNEKSAISHYYLAQAIGQQNRFEEAEREFLMSIKLGGDEMKEAHRYLAVIYVSRGDNKRAISELEAYLKLAPLAPDAEQLRALVQKLKGNKP